MEISTAHACGLCVCPSIVRRTRIGRIANYRCAGVPRGFLGKCSNELK
jgi:hypothetical protein